MWNIIECEYDEHDVSILKIPQKSSTADRIVLELQCTQLQMILSRKKEKYYKFQTKIYQFNILK